MKALKNTIAGFLVSFVGSIPLGYLNIIGFEIYSKNGIEHLVPYLLGVVVIEAVVIYFTLVFANRLMNNKRLAKSIALFSIFFMLLLAFSFYFKAESDSDMDYLSAYNNYPPLLIGIIFSSLNFIQIPFWTGWNLYLVNSNFIAIEKNAKYFYIAGTLAGTFLGMLGIILFLKLVAGKVASFSNLISYIFPIFFLGMAILQAYKFYKKYYYKKQ